MATEFTRSALSPAMARAAEVFLAYFDELEGRRVAPVTDRDALESWLLGSLDDDGIGIERAIDEVAERVVPQSMATPHPLYMGLVNSSPLPAGVLGDLFVSTLNNNGAMFHQSPAATIAEHEVLRSLAQRLGLPEGTSGMVLPGGTYANLQALQLARTRAFPDVRRDGMASLGRRPTIYASAAVHFSIARAAQTLGVGERDVAAIATAGRGAMSVEALQQCIRRDLAGGRAPFAVIATAGTTGTGAIDPLSDIADVCREHGLWLHVDACYGGAAALLPELRAAFAGLGRADSVATDAHKWFFLPIAAGVLLTQHPEIERAAYALDASYVPYVEEDDALYRGLPTSRRASGLAVWLALRAHGFGTVRAAVARNIAQTRALESRLSALGWNVLEGGDLSIACARYEPAGMSAADLDQLQSTIARAAVSSGRAWFATVRHDDKIWMRFNILNLHTRDDHIDTLVGLLADLARSNT